MKNEWLRYVKGSISITITGENKIPFVNECLNSGVELWDLKTLSNGDFNCCILLKDIRKIRSIRFKYKCKIRFQKRIGLPFFLKKAFKNAGFSVGALLFLALIFLLSNMVWDIKITGAAPDLEYKLHKQLTKEGIKRGALQFFIPSPQEIQKRLTDTNSEITWVGVNVKGTVLHFRIVEKTIQKPPNKLKPRHLVATKKAVIEKIFVEKGQALVGINDYVEPGQVLVTGLVGKDKKFKKVAAKAEVIGETWYKSSVEVTLNKKIEVLTGKNYTNYSVKVSNTSIPIPLFNKKEFSKTESMKSVVPVYFLKWQLPFYIGKERVFEKEIIELNYTVDQAKFTAKEIATRNVKQLLNTDAKIKGIKVLRQQTTNGKVVMLFHFQVLENIGVYNSIR
ncbi:MAG: sporulation protein YqfD [Bacillales bacterium]|jgi:similar to stage IV sporulation protein|nr:sporulation protein YqfD [Bacillales bacterium]